jgi:hypothetical protein
LGRVTGCQGVTSTPSSRTIAWLRTGVASKAATFRGPDGVATTSPLRSDEIRTCCLPPPSPTPRRTGVRPAKHGALDELYDLIEMAAAVPVDLDLMSTKLRTAPVREAHRAMLCPPTGPPPPPRGPLMLLGFGAGRSSKAELRALRHRVKSGDPAPYCRGPGSLKLLQACLACVPCRLGR